MKCPHCFTLFEGQHHCYGGIMEYYPPNPHSVVTELVRLAEEVTRLKIKMEYMEKWIEVKG